MVNRPGNTPNVFKKCLLLLLSVLFFAVFAAGEENETAAPAAEEKKVEIPQSKTPFKNFASQDEPTYVKSDSLLLNTKEQTFVYTGNVEVINGDLQILADSLTGRYDKNNQIIDLVAEKNVRITKGENIRANGEKAVYTKALETIVLTENPEVQRDGSILSADKITIYLNEDRSIAEGRVRVKLIKEEEQKKG